MLSPLVIIVNSCIHNLVVRKQPLILFVILPTKLRIRNEYDIIKYKEPSVETKYYIIRIPNKKTEGEFYVTDF